MKYLCILLLTASCASVSAPSADVQTKQVRTKSIEEMRTGELLELALQLFNAKHYQQASKVFHLVLKKNELNEAGKILTYWHIGVCYGNLGDVEQADIYLYDFLVSAELFLAMDEKEQARYTNGTFAKDFLLKKRHDTIKKYLEDKWDTHKKKVEDG